MRAVELSMPEQQVALQLVLCTRQLFLRERRLFQVVRIQPG